MHFSGGPPSYQGGGPLSGDVVLGRDAAAAGAAAEGESRHLI